MTTAGPDRENEQELRLALALRGGTSLAVWLGGAVAEINTLRGALVPESDLGDAESPAATPEHPWAALAKLAGYDSVAVDVLAGASAGGLNAALLAASIVYGMPFDRMRRMWVSMADAESMARPVPRFWQPRPPSLFDGDGYFRREVKYAMSSAIPPPDRAKALGDRLDLVLTATLLDPIDQVRYDQLGERLTQRRRRAWFRFRHRGRPGLPLSDFGADAELETTLRRLALAARTSASVPGGFEPSRVFSTMRRSGTPDMAGLFSETSDSGPFRVIDGGVLDNIPIEDAVWAIASASSDRPTDRWLLYLNPEPDPVGEVRPRAQALPVFTAASQAMMSQEAALGDIEILENHNRAAEDIALRRKALFAELRSVPAARRRAALARQAAAVLPDHAVVRAELDVRAVNQLVGDPHVDDGNLLPPVPGDPLSGWSAQARTRLPDGLWAHFVAKASAEPRSVFADVGALLAGVRECLGWAQDVERFATGERAGEIGSCKAALYRLWLLGELLKAHADRYWIDGARLEPIVDLDELDGWVRRAAHRGARLQHELPSPVRPLLGAVLSSVQGDEDARFQRELAEFAAELLSIVESSGADAVADDGLEDDDRVDAVAEMTTLLHRIAARLAFVAAGRSDPVEADQIGYALLEQADDDERPAVLHELVVLMAPLDVGRAPGSVIKFARIISDEQSPLPFTALRRDQRAPLRAADKIRGLALGTFGAFLSAQWRANDWMWGRLDATASLVRLLLDPPRLARRNAAGGADGVLGALEAVVTRPTAAELGALDERTSQQWQDFLTELWAVHETEVRSEVAALFADQAGGHSLPRTTRLLIERLQWTVVARELPYVATVPRGADIMGGDVMSGEQAAVPDPTRLAADVRRYSVGRQRVADLGEQRTARMATRFGLLGYRAVLPGGGLLQWLEKAAMIVAKPLLMAIVFAVAAPTRAALTGFLAAAAVSLTRPGDGALPGRPPGSGGAADWLPLLSFSGGSFGPTVLLAVVLTVVFAAWLGWQLACRIPRPAGVDRRVLAVVIAIAVLAVVFLVSATGFRLGPIGLAAAGVLLTWLATLAYRAPSRAAAVAVTAVSFALVMAVASPAGGGWILAVLLLAAYLHMVLLGTVDVLPPRPQPLRHGSRPAGSGDTVAKRRPVDDQRVTPGA